MTCKNVITLNDEVVKHIQEIRIGKKTRYTIYGFSEDKTEIIIKKIGASDATIEDLIADLPDNDVCYVAYHYGFDVDDGTRRGRTCFITWVPSKADRAKKFLAACSKTGLRNQLGGGLVDFLFSTKDEITEEEFYDKCIKTIH